MLESLDKSKHLRLRARSFYRNDSVSISFLDDLGLPVNIEGYGLRFLAKLTTRSKGELFELSEGNGLTVNNNILTIDLLDNYHYHPYTYYYVVIDNTDKVLLSGPLQFTDKQMLSGSMAVVVGSSANGGLVKVQIESDNIMKFAGTNTQFTYYTDISNDVEFTFDNANSGRFEMLLTLTQGVKLKFPANCVSKSAEWEMDEAKTFSILDPGQYLIVGAFNPQSNNWILILH